MVASTVEMEAVTVRHIKTIPAFMLLAASVQAHAGWGVQAQSPAPVTAKSEPVKAEPAPAKVDAFKAAPAAESKPAAATKAKPKAATKTQKPADQVDVKPVAQSPRWLSAESRLRANDYDAQLNTLLAEHGAR